MKELMTKICKYESLTGFEKKRNYRVKNVMKKKRTKGGLDEK